MGKPTGFLEYKRELPSKRPVQERRKDYNEFVNLYEPEQLNKQSARCMNCGIPFCHHGCPLGNVIPEFNDAVYRKAWQDAYDILVTTTNFPVEFVLLPAKPVVYWGSTNQLSPSKRSKNILLKSHSRKVL